MTNEQFRELVLKCEREAKAHPDFYRLKLLFWVIFGYGVFGGALSIALLLALLMVAIAIAAVANGSATGILLLLKFMIPLGIFIGAAVKAMWIRMTPPKGIEITWTNAPELLEMIEEVRAKLKAKPISKVFLTMEMNAAAVQVPRLGVFGLHRNYLVLGMWLMESLTPDQLKSVIAHELGHFSGNHGRFGGWLYRVRMTWLRLWAIMRAKSRGSIARFVSWYVPRFDARVFVLAREHEYIADRCAAEATSPRIAASALVHIHARATFLQEHFWDRIPVMAESQQEPFGDICERIAGGLRGGFLEGGNQAQYITKSFQQRGSIRDTHPDLAERLRALGFTGSPDEACRIFAPPQQDAVSAAERYLGGNHHLFVDQVNADWQALVRPGWDGVRRDMEKARVAAGNLEKKTAGELTVTELLQLGAAKLDLGQKDEAFALFEAGLAKDPASPAAILQVGRMRLERGDESALALFRKFPDGTHTTILRYAAQVVDQYMTPRGREAEAEAFEDFLAGIAKRSQLAQQERASVSPVTAFLPHGLPPEEVIKIASSVSQLKWLKVLYIVRKAVPGDPMLVIGVERFQPALERSVQESTARNLNELNKLVSFEPAYVFVPLEKGGGEIGKNIRAIPGSVVYRKK